MHGINEIVRLNQIEADNHALLVAQGVSTERTAEQEIAHQGSEVQPVGASDGAQG